MTQPGEMLNSTGASIQPCLTPVPTPNVSDLSPPSHLGLHSQVELLQEVHTNGAFKMQEDFPKKVTIYGIKNFEKVHKGHEQVLFLFTAFFLQLACSEDHVHSASVLSEATQRFREEILSDYVNESA